MAKTRCPVCLPNNNRKKLRTLLFGVVVVVVVNFKILEEWFAGKQSAVSGVFFNQVNEAGPAF